MSEALKLLGERKGEIEKSLATATSMINMLREKHDAHCVRADELKARLEELDVVMSKLSGGSNDQN